MEPSDDECEHCGWTLAGQNELKAEIARLRSALRNISKGRVGDQIIMDVSEYAKAQLRAADSADEGQK